MADEVYTDIDDLFERWAIMTAQGKWGDIAAMRYCLAHCTPAIAQAFTQRIDSITAKRNALVEYIEAGYWLVPCKEVNGEQKLCRDLYIDKATKKIDPAMQIKDKAALKTWQDRGVVNFGLYPIRNRLIVIDLDRGDAHANKSDGIKDFIDLIATLKLTPAQQAYFADFPVNFPCYVESAHGGIHLYFRDDYIDPDTKKELINGHVEGKNIEVKYTTKITVAGSIRADGNRYLLRGMLNHIPNMTNALIKAIKKPASKRPTRTASPASTPARGQWQGKRNNWTQGKRNVIKWNDNPDTIFAMARKQAPGGAHDFVLQALVYFHNAYIDIKEPHPDYNKATVTSWIERTPEHINRTDKADTYSCINSIYV